MASLQSRAEEKRESFDQIDTTLTNLALTYGLEAPTLPRPNQKDFSPESVLQVQREQALIAFISQILQQLHS